MKRRSLLLAGVPLLGLALACRRAAEPPAVRARFGVFFGGDVQEREEIPLVLDRTRQSMGIRLEFTTPPTGEARVTWEVEKPAPGKKAEGTIVDYGEARTRPAEPVLDIPLVFRQTDRPGAWRIRVALDGKSVLERGFKVVPASDAPREE